MKESDEQKAERLVAEMLRQAKWSADDLKRRRKSDAKKARLAAKLRPETAMTWQWIAERLAMGHWRTAANAVPTDDFEELRTVGGNIALVISDPFDCTRYPYLDDSTPI